MFQTYDLLSESSSPDFASRGGGGGQGRIAAASGLSQDVSGDASRVDVKNLDMDGLRAFVMSLGDRGFRAKQLHKWIYQKDAASFDEMTDLSKSFRALLSRRAFISGLEPYRIMDGDDGTRKFLFRLRDGYEIESVLIPEERRQTLCISTQVGCPLACSFCVTGLGGVKRNLVTAEIIGQVQAVRRRMPAGKRLSNIVVMGMGEPLLNYENVVRALRICLDDDGFGFSHRRITLSTAGVVPGIHRLARDLPVNLAISLNAVTQSLREKIMPIARRYDLDALLDACRRYPLQRNKKLTFEYVLLKGLNDSLDDAKRLIRLLRGIQCIVNLIPYNENEWIGYRSPSREQVKRFQDVLIRSGMMASVRWSRGPDISAACGQLGASRVRDKTRTALVDSGPSSV